MLTEYIVTRLGGCHPPAFAGQECLTNRGSKKPCTLCATVCPSGAVTIRRGKRVMDAEACDGCGVCVSVCPSLALSCEKPDYGKILEDLKSKGNLFLFCREQNPAKVGEGLVLPCLGGVPWEFLAAVSLQAGERTIILDISKCISCYRRKTLWVLFAAIKKARSFVEMTGHSFSLQASPGNFLQKNPDDPGLTRREVFSKLTGAVRREALGFFPGPPGRGGREELLSRLQKCPAKEGKSPVPGDLPFMNWQVKDDCRLCGSCRGVCPRGAWKLKKEEGQAVLYHSPWKCTSCGLCRSLCPGHALLPSLWEGLPPQGARLKKISPLQTCRLCRSTGVPAGKEGLCLNCRKREKVKAELIKQTEKARAVPVPGVTPKGWKEGA